MLDVACSDPFLASVVVVAAAVGAAVSQLETVAAESALAVADFAMAAADDRAAAAVMVELLPVIVFVGQLVA